MTTKKKVVLSNKAPPEKITIGPCSDMQALVFQRATEVDFLLIGGSRGKKTAAT